MDWGEGDARPVLPSRKFAPVSREVGYHRRPSLTTLLGVDRRRPPMSLLEVLTAITITGIVVSAAARGWSRFADRVAVEAAQGAVLNGYRRAQSAARAWGRPAEITVSTDSIVIRTIGIADTVELWRAPGPARSGVALTPATHVSSFGASGLATGPANVSHVLQRGAVRRAVIVSRLGRVRVR
jgi:type II secretory pathway pseudopilin PulG